MDPALIIVTALTIGAANALKTVSEAAIVDSYNGLKELIKSKYDSINIELVEKDPKSESRQEVVKEEIEAANLSKDKEVIEKASQLIQIANSKIDRAMFSEIGVEIREVDGNNLEVKRINSNSRGVLISNSRFSGNISVTDVDSAGSDKKKH